MWTRSKARAARAVKADKYCECNDSPSTTRRSLFQSPAQLPSFLRNIFSSKPKASTPLGPAISFQSLSRASDSDEEDETLDQLPDSTLIARDNPLVTIFDRQLTEDQSRRDTTQSLRPRIEELPPQTSQTRTEEFPHPPPDWLSVHAESESANQVRSTENNLYDPVAIPIHQPERIEQPEQPAHSDHSASSSFDSIREMEDSLERQLENMRVERLDHENRMSALHDACQESMSMRGMLNFPTFKGDDSEDVRDFLSNYARVADICGWSREKSCRALPLHLKGPASAWFNSLPDRDDLTFDQLAKALEKQYASGASKWQLTQILDERKQREGETINSYTTDIRKQCNRLNLPPAECLKHFVRGLKEEIRSYVVLQQPETIEQAENYARLKEVTLKSESKTKPIDSKELSAEILRNFKELGIIPSQPTKVTTASVTLPAHNENMNSRGAQFTSLNFPTPVADFSENSLNPLAYPSLPVASFQPHSMPSTNAQQYADSSRFQQYPSSLNSQWQSNSMPPTSYNDFDFRQPMRDETQQPFSDQNRGRPFRPGDFRNRRSTRGVINCGYCGKRGHAMFNCRFLHNSQDNGQNQYQVQNRGRGRNPNYRSNQSRNNAVRTSRPPQEN